MRYLIVFLLFTGTTCFGQLDADHQNQQTQDSISMDIKTALVYKAPSCYIKRGGLQMSSTVSIPQLELESFVYILDGSPVEKNVVEKLDVKCIQQVIVLKTDTKELFCRNPKDKIIVITTKAAVEFADIENDNLKIKKLDMHRIYEPSGKINYATFIPTIKIGPVHNGFFDPVPSLKVTNLENELDPYLLSIFY